MAVDPHGNGVHAGRDLEAELRRLKGRFRAVSRRYERAIELRRSRTWAAVTIERAIVAGALYGTMMAAAPGADHHAQACGSDPELRCRRAMGLTPARGGQPGYYCWHDRDRDGIAFEPWPP